MSEVEGFEMKGTCSTNGRDDDVKLFGREERNHLEDLGVDERYRQIGKVVFVLNTP
jgi:serine kinase of HPr protein (carbohydrate metabolism regulator)